MCLYNNMRLPSYRPTTITSPMRVKAYLMNLQKQKTVYQNKVCLSKLKKARAFCLNHLQPKETGYCQSFMQQKEKICSSVNQRMVFIQLKVVTSTTRQYISIHKFKNTITYHSFEYNIYNWRSFKIISVTFALINFPLYTPHV